MRLFNLKNAVLGSALGLVTIVGATSASAQNRNEEYREWQRAQRQAQEELRDYRRSGSRSDYRDYQKAQRRAQKEYREYQRLNRTVYNNGNGNGYGYGRANRNSNGTVYYRNGQRVYPNATYGNNTSYRVYRNGSYYQTDSRGAELLRQAVNSGYQQGYNQGQNDRRYNRGGDYYGNNVYRNGTYGYQSYVDRSQYQYYFQQGFQRGYQDGLNSQTQYGYRSNNSVNILGTILNSILSFTQN